MSSVNWFQTQCRRSLPSGVSTLAGAARLGLRRLDAAFGFSPLSCGASQPSQPLPSDLNKAKLSDLARSIGYRKAPDATHVKAASSPRTPRLACGGQGTTSQAAQNPGFFVFPATDPGSKLFLGLAEGDPPAHFTPRPSCSADFVPPLRRNFGSVLQKLHQPSARSTSGALLEGLGGSFHHPTFSATAAAIHWFSDTPSCFASVGQPS